MRARSLGFLAGVFCGATLVVGCVDDGSIGGSVPSGAASDAATSHDGGSGGSGSHDAGSGGGGGSSDAGATSDAATPTSKDAGSSTPPATDAGAAVDAPNTTPTGDDAGSTGGPTAEQSEWLAQQNAARALVGEMPLEWDPIAAQVAQNYAAQCNYLHNPNRTTDYAALGGSGYVGENIAAGAPTQSITDAVASWCNEVSIYDHATNSCTSTTQECGHYTQIVWDTTTKVGCAKVSCTTGSPFGTFGGGQWDYSVCDYTPGGNIVGVSPY